ALPQAFGTFAEGADRAHAGDRDTRIKRLGHAAASGPAAFAASALFTASTRLCTVSVSKFAPWSGMVMSKCASMSKIISMASSEAIPKSFKVDSGLIAATSTLACLATMAITWLATSSGERFSVMGISALRDARTRGSSKAPLRLGDELVQQHDSQVDFLVADFQRGRQRDDVLVPATHVQHEADLLALVREVAGQANVDHAVEQRLVRRVAVLGADLGAQGEAEAVHVADFLVALLQVAQTFEEVRALARHAGLVIHLLAHAQHFQAKRGTQRVGVERGVRRARRKHGGVDQLLARPQPRQRVEAVGQRLAEHQHVGLDAEILDRPQLSGAPETHLDFVDHEQDAVLVQHLLQVPEEIPWRHHVATGALDRLDVERRVLALVGLGIPHAVVFGLEQAGELAHATVRVLLGAHAPGPAEWI